MNSLIEFHGRLSRGDKRPANPGGYCLQFQLHGHQKSGSQRDKVYWEEVLEDVTVSPGGFYRVVLGQKLPVDSKMFTHGVRWMSIRVVRSGKLEDENGFRIPVLGQSLILGRDIERASQRMGVLEDKLAAAAGSAPKVEQFQTRLKRIADGVAAVQARVVAVEDGGELKAMIRRMEALTTRLDEVDKDEGRLDRLELEMVDLVGPQGDVVDLNSRMDSVESRAPELIRNLRKRDKNAPDQLALGELKISLDGIRVQIAGLQSMCVQLESLVGSGTADIDPESIGAVKRSGDVMTGGLTINRGGLSVLSGGVSCRGATVTTLDASNVIKAPKMIAEAFELRGDLTVDSAQRSLQIRAIEGRQASARRDGALHLNPRGGAEIVIGNQDASKGVDVHGSVRANSIVSQSSGGIAQIFHATGALEVGDVVRINDSGERVARVRKAADPRVVGVVTDSPGVLLGGVTRTGSVSVAIAGVVLCRVEAESGPVEAGALLVSSKVAGHACACVEPDSGTRLGKALAPLSKGRGLIPVLLTGG
jgi:hypothetical protein